MAKKETVFFTLPIDQMNGKMATKQLNIQYAGQARDETAYNLPIGRHMATNFKKYVVLTKVRGKNRFYVKSRTTVNNTVYTKYSQALMALCSSLATQLDLAAKARPEQRPYAGILRSYDEMAAEGMQLRDYLTSIILTQVRDRVETLEAPFKPVPGQAPESEEIGDNPFYLPTQQYNAAGITLSFTKSDTQKKVMQKYYPALVGIYTGVDVCTINYVAPNMKKGKLQVLAVSGTSTFGDATGTIQGNALQLQLDESVTPAAYRMVVYDGRGNIAAGGWIYTDADHETPVTAATVITDGMTVYFDN